MLSSDFCINPEKYSIALAPPGSVRDHLQYYTTCNGTSPSAAYVNDAKQYAQLLNDTINTLTSTVCKDNQNLTALYSTTASIFESIGHVDELLLCPPIQKHWLGLLHDDFCNSMFEGLYVLWISQYVTVLFLFIVAIVGSLIHNFFGAFWNVTEATIEQDQTQSKRQRAVEHSLVASNEEVEENSDVSISDLEEFHDEHSDGEENRSNASQTRKGGHLEIEQRDPNAASTRV